jgi:hypothetical protein
MCHRILTALFLAATTATLAAQSNVSFETYGVTQSNNGGSGYHAAIVTGDFNNDGKPDIVQCCNSSNQLMFLEGNGDGTFQAPAVAFGTASDLPDLVAADVNGDGKLDLIAVGALNPAQPPAASSYTLLVFLGNGDGTFQAPQSYSLGSDMVNAGPLVVGNFFGDGRPDVATQLVSGAIGLFRNEGDGTFVQDGSMTVGGQGLDTLVAGDLNGNGVTDLVAAVDEGETNNENVGETVQVNVYWNDGNGNFTPATVGSYTYQQQVNLAIGRLNGTAQMGLLASYSCTTGIACTSIDGYYGQGNNTVFKRTLVTTSGTGAPAFQGPLFGVDVNGDGYGDIAALVIVCNPDTDASCTGGGEGLAVWLGNADGSFQQTPQYFFTSAGDTGPVAMADFNRDGMMDFAGLALNGPTYLETYLNASQRTGCGTYTISPTVTVCDPVDNTYSPSPVTVHANSYDTTAVTAMQEYIDGSLDYSEPVTSFDETFPVSDGSHLLVTKAWDQSGRSFVAERTVTAYTGTPGPVCYAAQNSASICLPSGDSSSSPVEILANGDTGANIPTAAQLYIDGQLVVNNQAIYEFSEYNAADSYVQVSESLAPGTHDLVFKIWDQAGNVYEAQKTITVN